MLQMVQSLPKISKAKGFNWTHQWIKYHHHTTFTTAAKYTKSVQSESYLNKTDSHCGPKVLSLQSIKPCCGKNQKWTAHSELAGNLRRTGGDTGEGVEGDLTLIQQRHTRGFQSLRSKINPPSLSESHPQPRPSTSPPLIWHMVPVIKVSC